MLVGQLKTVRRLALATKDFEIAESEKVISKYKANQDNIPLDLKIIKSATARYKVKNVKQATYKIKAIAQKHGAYISDLRFQNDLYKKENRFTIKVPQKYFDIVMDSVNAVVDFVEYENITTKDVTEEYIDLETRLKTKLEVKERYESILRKNAKTVEDIYNATTSTATQYTEPDIIEAYVTSNDQFGNFFKEVHLQTLDGSRGFSIPVDVTDLYTIFNPGRKVSINLQNTYTQLQFEGLEIGNLAIDERTKEEFIGKITATNFKNVLVKTCDIIDEEQSKQAVIRQST